MTENNPESIPEIVLLWNRVTALVFQSAERACHENGIIADNIDKFTVCGRETVETFDNLIHIIGKLNFRRFPRRLSAYMEYIELDKTTLADVAPYYNVSRERIRQFVKHVDINLSRYYKKVMLLDDAEFNCCVKRLADIFESVDYNAVALAVHGLWWLGEKKKKAIFNMLFGNDFSQKIIVESRDQINILEKQKELLRKSNAVIDEWNLYRAKICFPSDFSADQSIPVASLDDAHIFEPEKRFRKKLKKFEGLIEIIEKPDIVYYSTPKNEYRPDLMIKMSDGKTALALVVKPANMAFIYNIQRFNELHRFCKKNGYGYLIVDACGTSIQEIRNRPVDPELSECLNTLLKNQGMIIWKNIKDIRETMPASNADIAAYVMQKRLYFTAKPFCIKHRTLD